MKQLIIKWKNKIDFIIYGIIIGKINPYFMTINFLILGYTLSQYEEFENKKNILILLILIFINIIWQFISTIQDCYQYLKKTGYYYSPSNKISLRFELDKDIEDNYTMIEIPILNNTIIFNQLVNNILTNNTIIHTKISKTKAQKVKKYIKTYCDITIHYLNWKWYEVKNHNGSFYNEKKLCMASEIVLDSVGHYSVTVNEGCYYNSYLTNNIYNMRMSHQNGFYIEPFLNSRNYPIKDLSISCMSDHIGVSTIAVSNDGYAIILRHNNRTAISSDKLLPSGSGSMNYSDLQMNEDFRKSIIKAAERELSEETHIPINIIQKTQIIGFYRDLNRGGKPEFCCITYLTYNRHDIREIIIPDNTEQRDDFNLIQIYNNNKFTPTAIENIFDKNPSEFSLALFMNCFMLYKNHDIDFSLLKNRSIT